MARPERFELPTTKFVAWCSIQLSYGRAARGKAVAQPAGLEIIAGKMVIVKRDDDRLLFLDNRQEGYTLAQSLCFQKLLFYLSNPLMS